METVFRWLGWGHTSLARARRRFSRASAVALVGAAGLWVLGMVVVLAADWISWQGDAYSGPLFAGIIYLVGLITAISHGTTFLYRIDRDAAAAVALRELIRRAPEELVRPVANRPAATAAMPTPGLDARIGPFSWAGRGDRAWLAMVGWMALVAGLFGTVGGGLELSGTAPMARSPITLACAALAAAAGALVTLAGLALIVSSWRLGRRSLWLEATALDLRGWGFDVWPRRVSVPWGQARTFCQVTYAEGLFSSKDTTLYLLEGDDTAIAWALTPKADGAAAVDASAALCDLITTHTRLPLLDASAAASELKLTRDSTVARWAARYGTPASPKRPGRVVALLAALFLLAIVGFSVDSSLSSLEPAYYNLLVQRAHAQPPLYQSSLSQPDGRWALATDGDGTATYTGGAYQLTATHEPSVASLLGATYGDIAVQTTVHWSATQSYGVAGVVIRDDRVQREQVIFVVSGEYGYWELDLLPEIPQAAILSNESILARGIADSLHTGVGATNQLLVIVRGRQYLCYINGLFIGAGYDDTLTQGQPGLYVDGDAGPISFSDFAVYPTVR